MNRPIVRPLALALVCVSALFASIVPASAITGGTEDTANTHSNVGMLVFYQPDGRFRCSGTLVAPRVFLTAAHCTFEDIGQVIVTFDPVISRTAEESERDVPRAADDTGPDDAVSAIGYTSRDIRAPRYDGEQTWFLGTPRTHPEYSEFTDLDNWNDTGVVLLDTSPGLPTTQLAPENYLDQFEQPLFNSTEFLVIGYGTEVRGNPPTAELSRSCADSPPRSDSRSATRCSRRTRTRTTPAPAAVRAPATPVVRRSSTATWSAIRAMA
jgi:hypothetical protein